MKKMALILTTCLLGSILLMAGCRHGHDSEAHVKFVIDYLDEVLDLDSPQQAKLEAIKEELQAQAASLRETRKQLFPQLKAQLAADRIDTAVVKQAIAEHRRQVDKVIDLAVDRLAEFHAMLTPEQREKLVAKLEKIEKWHADPEE